MTIKEAVRKATEILKAANINAPASDAGVLLCHVLGCSRAYLYAHGTDNLNKTAEDGYFELVGERAARKPLQYLTGHTEFMSLNFLVTPDVLIPRQDTETLVEAVLQHVSKLPGQEAINILDIGTGSGCISVSLAKNLPYSRLYSLDLSREALALAKINAERLGVIKQFEFIQKDVFEGLLEPFAEIGLDVIVSNPPYIPDGDINTLEPEVRKHEPKQALAGGEDGLDFYRAIIREAPLCLKKGGLLAFETGFDQAATVADIMMGSFMDIRIIKDLSGIERVVTGSLKQA